MVSSVSTWYRLRSFDNSDQAGLSSAASTAEKMVIKPTVALRAILAGGVVAAAKVGAVVKGAGGAKIGMAAAVMAAGATAAVSGSKEDQNKSTDHSSEIKT